ncbi:hypothetical protein B0H19DRAFT_1078996 [Mycena capillaripes]|nr:hypothetical protein B0H19DRAFT_1078996 [Mycena capillaripes]
MPNNLSVDSRPHCHSGAQSGNRNSRQACHLHRCHCAHGGKYKLPGILTRLAEEAAEDNIFVRAVPKTAAQVAVQHAQAPDGPRSWWVVYIGREPGIYPTLEDADLQIKGCPNQQYRRKGSKKEALAYYKLLHEANEVEKWVELIDDE